MVKKLLLSLLIVSSAQGMHNQLRKATIIRTPSAIELDLCMEYRDIILPQKNHLSFFGQSISWQLFNDMMMHAMLFKAIKFMNKRETGLDKLGRFRTLLSHNEICNPFANELHLKLDNFKNNAHITPHEFSQQVLDIAQRFRERLHNRSDAE